VPSALSKGKENGQSEHAARTCALEPALQRARKNKMTEAQAQHSPSTVTNESGFAPLTPSRSDTGSSSDFSPVSDAEQEAQEVARSSEYSPVSDAEPEEQKVKTEAKAEDLLVEVKTETRAEDLRLAQAAQALTSRPSTT
jgi:hypothetical protein